MAIYTGIDGVVKRASIVKTSRYGAISSPKALYVGKSDRVYRVYPDITLADIDRLALVANHYNVYNSDSNGNKGSAIFTGATTLSDFSPYGGITYSTTSSGSEWAKYYSIYTKAMIVVEFYAHLYLVTKSGGYFPFELAASLNSSSSLGINSFSIPTYCNIYDPTGTALYKYVLTFLGNRASSLGYTGRGSGRYVISIPSTTGQIYSSADFIMALYNKNNANRYIEMGISAQTCTINNTAFPLALEMGTMS